MSTKSEDILGEKWDRCLSDTGIKMAGGLVMGKSAEAKFVYLHS